MVVVVMVLRGSPWTGLVLWTLLLVTTSYHVVCRPFVEGKTNLIGALHELAIMLACVPLFIIMIKQRGEDMAHIVVYLLTGSIVLTTIIEGTATAWTLVGRITVIIFTFSFSLAWLARRA